MNNVLMCVCFVGTFALCVNQAHGQTTRDDSPINWSEWNDWKDWEVWHAWYVAWDEWDSSQGDTGPDVTRIGRIVGVVIGVGIASLTLLIPIGIVCRYKCKQQRMRRSGNTNSNWTHHGNRNDRYTVSYVGNEGNITSRVAPPDTSETDLARENHVSNIESMVSRRMIRESVDGIHRLHGGNPQIMSSGTLDPRRDMEQDTQSELQNTSQDGYQEHIRLEDELPPYDLAIDSDIYLRPTLEPNDRFADNQGTISDEPAPPPYNLSFMADDHSAYTNNYNNAIPVHSRNEEELPPAYDTTITLENNISHSDTDTNHERNSLEYNAESEARSVQCRRVSGLIESESDEANVTDDLPGPPECVQNTAHGHIVEGVSDANSGHDLDFNQAHDSDSERPGANGAHEISNSSYFADIDGEMVRVSMV